MFSEKSLDDLDAVLKYIGRHKPTAAIRFVASLEDVCETLRRFPELGELREELALRLRLFTFRGYGIYYRNLGRAVRIERVLHPALDIRKQAFD